MSKLFEHRTHCLPAPPEEVSVKSLVSKFNQNTIITDNKIKLPPEKRNIKDKNGDTATTTSGESSVIDGVEQDQQQTNRRRRQGSDDGYNSATSSDTPRTSSGKTGNTSGISSETSSNSEILSSQSEILTSQSEISSSSSQSENETTSPSSSTSSPIASRGNSPEKVQENKTLLFPTQITTITPTIITSPIITATATPSSKNQILIVPKSSKAETPQHKINCKEKHQLSQLSSSGLNLNTISSSTTNLSSNLSNSNLSNSTQKVQKPSKNHKPPKLVTTSFKDLYSVRKLLSESSINKIYLGVHRTTGQEVVIKKLVKCQESLNELVYTKAASKIAPKYCLPILYSEKTNSSYVMVIPKYGLSLYDFMYERQETLSFEEARRTYKKILKALCKLQRYQIYHFDIKEENVCIDPQTLNIKLIDFGGAAQSMPNRFTGSFEFAAPEMFMKIPAKEASAQADVWSFGVSLYSAVCGVTPYQNIDEVFEPRFRRKFDEKRGDLPDDLIEVLKHTVVPEHEKRVSFEALRSFAFFR